MTNVDLLGIGDVPDGFVYPAEFGRFLTRSTMKFVGPWFFANGEFLRSVQSSLPRRYPARRLVFFAKRDDNDDVACFDLDVGDVPVVHLGASPGWEQRGPRFPDFAGWLRQAIEDSLEYEGWDDEDLDPTRRLPLGHEYPEQLVCFLNTGVKAFGRWEMLTTDRPAHPSTDRLASGLIPFAQRSGTSDVAAIRASDGRVVVQNVSELSNSDPGTHEFPAFADWLRSATEEVVVELREPPRPHGTGLE